MGNSDERPRLVGHARGSVGGGNDGGSSGGGGGGGSSYPAIDAFPASLAVPVLVPYPPSLMVVTYSPRSVDLP